MDPASGIGIAAAVIQFVDFGSKVVARSSEYHHSATGLALGNSELERVTKDLVRLSTGLDKSLKDSSNVSNVSPNQEQLQALGKECQSVASELLAVLERLKVNSGASRWRSFRQAFLSVWKSEQIEGLEKRLDRFRMQLIVRSLDSLR